MRQGGKAAGCVGAVCLVSLLACDASTLTAGQAPRPLEPVAAAHAPVAPVTATSVTSPGTALLAVRLTPSGEVAVGAVRPKPIPWREALTPYTPPPGLARAPSEAGSVRSGSPGVTRAPAADDAPHYILVVVVRAPGVDPQARSLLLDAPGHSRGDVVDPWTTGGAVWRMPWYGAGTTYEVVRVSPRPTVLARWPTR